MKYSGYLKLTLNPSQFPVCIRVNSPFVIANIRLNILIVFRYIVINFLKLVSIRNALFHMQFKILTTASRGQFVTRCVPNCHTKEEVHVAILRKKYMLLRKKYMLPY